MIFLLSLFLILLPTYVIRFSIGPLPTTLLEIFFWIIFIVWIAQKKLSPRPASYSKFKIQNSKFIFLSITLFLLGATLSVAYATNLRTALGEWKAFYIEPFLFFLILIDAVKTKKDQQMLLFSLVLSGLAVSVLAIFQHFTGWMVPYDFWAKGGSFRVTGFYGYPNAVGLFLAPIIPVAIYLVIEKIKNLKIQDTRYKGTYLSLVFCLLFLLCAPLAILFAKSTGAVIGTVAGIGILLLLYKPTRLVTLGLGISGIIALLFLPQLGSVKAELLAQDRSGQIRIAMWSEAIELLHDHPVRGAGMASYSTRIVPYHKTVNGEGIEIFHLPHNLLLSIWVNTGFVGFFGFVGMIGWAVCEMWKRRETLIGVMFLSVFATILVHGLVDTPYIKNDLSMLFWFLFAIMCVTSYDNMEKEKI